MTFDKVDQLVLAVCGIAGVFLFFFLLMGY